MSLKMIVHLEGQPRLLLKEAGRLIKQLNIIIKTQFSNNLKILLF